MRANVRDVLKAFATRKPKGKLGDSISTDGTNVFSYRTCLITRHKGVTVLNMTKYSRTTSTQQHSIRCLNWTERCTIVTDAPMGCTPDRLLDLAKVPQVA